jgi:WD40 repeat protein
VSFAPDGRLVTAGTDGTARIWDLKHPKATPVVLTGHYGFLSALSFAPDGRLVTAGGDGKPRVWVLDPKRLIELASEVVGRNLTLAEWDRFFMTGIGGYHRTFKNLRDGKGVAEMLRASPAGPAANGSTPASTPAASGAVTK